MEYYTINKPFVIINIYTSSRSGYLEAMLQGYLRGVGAISRKPADAMYLLGAYRHRCVCFHAGAPSRAIQPAGKWLQLSRGVRNVFAATKHFVGQGNVLLQSLRISRSPRTAARRVVRMTSCILMRLAILNQCGRQAESSRTC